MAVPVHFYSAAKDFGDFGLSAIKIGVLTPSALKRQINQSVYFGREAVIPAKQSRTPGKQSSTPEKLFGRHLCAVNLFNKGYPIRSELLSLKCEYPSCRASKTTC